MRERVQRQTATPGMIGGAKPQGAAVDAVADRVGSAWLPFGKCGILTKAALSERGYNFVSARTLASLIAFPLCPVIDLDHR